MATPMNFQALNFGDIPGQEREARKRYYDSLASIGGVISSTGDKVDDYLQRKQREAEDKKKWDNMIAQQEYQKEQDRLAREYQASRDDIADERYDNEMLQKMEEINLANQQRTDDRAAMEQYKEDVKRAYTPEYVEKYGPTAKANLAAVMAAKTYDEAVRNGSSLGQGIYQQDLLNDQREQFKANAEREAKSEARNNVYNSVLTGLYKNGIDITGTHLPKTKAEAQAQINLIDSYLGNDFLGGIDSFDTNTGELAFKLKNLKERLEKVGTPKKKPPRDWEEN